MKTRLALFIILLASLTGAIEAAPLTTARVDASISDSGLLFIENVGQFPPDVRFYVYGAERPLWLGDDGLALALPGDGAARGGTPEIGMLYAPYDALPAGARAEVAAVERPSIARVGFAGSEPAASASQLEPFGRLDTRVHFYPSSDPTAWREDVPVWRGAHYRDVVPGVDLEITALDGQLAWRLTGRTKGQLDLPLRVEGADGVWESDGALHISTATLLGDLVLSSPTIAYAPLFVAPDTPAAVSNNPMALLASTFWGSSADDYLAALTLGADGTVYIAGYTSAASADFTAPLFAAGFSPDLTALRYLIFFGDVNEFEYDSVSDIAVDGAGNVYLVGTTYSRQFPVTAGAFDTVLNDGRAENCSNGWQHKPCPDAFAVKLNGAGQLVYGAYLGGAELDVPGISENFGGDDYGVGIGVDGAGRIYVVGKANSDDFPTTPGAYDRTFSYILNLCRKPKTLKRATKWLIDTVMRHVKT